MSEIIPVKEWRANKHLYLGKGKAPTPVSGTGKKRNPALVKGKRGELIKSETQEQIAVARHLTLYYPEPQYWWTATYNGANTSDRQRKMIAAMGGKKGVPDILIFNPSADGSYVGLAIEMKTEVGRATDYQENWLAGLKRLGWKAIVSQGAAQAIECIDKYFGK